MNKKIHSLMMLTLLLIGTSALTFNTQPAKAEPRTWYVDDDGGGDFTKIQDAIDAASPGDTIYVYNGTYYEHVVVDKSLSLLGEARDMTIIDGGGTSSVIYVTNNHTAISGFTVRNSSDDWPPGAGILLDRVTNCSVSGSNVADNYYGIFVNSSSLNIISGNKVTNNYEGIYSYYSSNNTMANNNASHNYYDGMVLYRSPNTTLQDDIFDDNWYSLEVIGWGIDDFIQYIDTSNLINGKPVYYLMDLQDESIDSSWNVGYLGLINCINVTVENIEVTDNGDGLLIANSHRITVKNSVFVENHNGIMLWAGSSNNTIEGNIISNTSDVGIYFDSACNNLISGNEITHHGVGIKLYSTADQNSFSGNMIRDNYFGLFFNYAGENSVYHNSFINNTYQARDDAPGWNFWDNGYPSGGNYWSDQYHGDCADHYNGPSQDMPGSDGIVDTPYVIDSNNQDNYPLMEPYSPLPRTIDELKAEIEELGSDGEIDNPGVVTSLLAKLNAAKMLIDDGKIDQAKIILKSFIRQVQNLTGIHITKDAAELLIESAEYILSNL